MKHLLPFLAFIFIFISCSKKSKVEPVFEPTNELVGTTWGRTISADIYNYLEFKTTKQIQFSSKFKGELETPVTGPYTLNRKSVVYIIAGLTTEGIISGDTMTVMGATGFTYIFVKVP